jgi:hypothetical protein
VKVAVIGAEGTGKSDLVEGIRRALRLPVLAPLKDELLEQSGYHTLFEWAEATGGWATLVARQAARERAVAEAVVDDGALQLYCVFQRWGWNRVSPDRVEGLRAEALACASGYERVLLTPPEVVAGYAPARFRNAAHNLQVHRLLQAFAREAGLGPRLVALAAAEPPQRLAQALAALQGGGRP